MNEKTGVIIAFRLNTESLRLMAPHSLSRAPCVTGISRSTLFVTTSIRKSSLPFKTTFPAPGLIRRQRRSIFGKCIPFSKAQERTEECTEESPRLIGEDAAVFNLTDQKLSSWIIFSILLSTVLAGLYTIWISPQTGYADEFLSVFTRLSSSPEVVILCLLAVFGVTHSGLAAARPQGEKLIGTRSYRVIFALVSLPLAALTVGYFINHRYQGTQLWMLQDLPIIHSFVWFLSFVSFWFLYPSTFNLLEVAAVDEPQLHLWETGVMRITRHPQAFGQFLWCFAHTLWIGNSFMVVTSLGLILHHAFGCWHGDRRLAEKYGDQFDEIKSRTSTLPFQAILEGKQKLPKDYYKEFLRVPYLVIALFTLGTYIVHPLLFRVVYQLGW